MKEAPYFRFYPAEWKGGKISAFGALEQGIYLNLCILSWTKGGEFEIEKELFAKQMEISEEKLSEIIEKFLHFRILFYANAMQNIYVIKFVMQQFQASKHLSKIRAKSADKRWQNPPQNHANAMQTDANAIYKDNDKDKDKEGIKTSVFTFDPIQNPPTLETVKTQAELFGLVFTLEESHAFISNYASKGWILPSGVIRDWRYRLKTWKENENKYNPKENNMKFTPAAEIIAENDRKRVKRVIAKEDAISPDDGAKTALDAIGGV